MNSTLPIQKIAELTDSESVEVIETIQSLWSGYGQIVRVRLLHNNETAIVKHVSPPNIQTHKYGWSGDVSHQRKLSSYANELTWYRVASRSCPPNLRIANLLGGDDADGHWLFVLEDLDAAGFPVRRSDVNASQLRACFQWLADLHAEFLCDTEIARHAPAVDLGLWPVGTYWHLATRPDEHESMPESQLKDAAVEIDQRLQSARYQTIVHGDAKLANFCLSSDDRVAAVDFQYVGGGCGMKDVVYFISSCFSDRECEQREQELLNLYFDCFQLALDNDELAKKVEQEWRELYALTWADFYRFLAGWSPGHWKMHGYSERQTRRALVQLE